MHFKMSLIILIIGLLISGYGSSSEEPEYSGVGIHVAQLYHSKTENNRGALVVLDVIKGSPASFMDIQKGDMITHVDGLALAGLDFQGIIQDRIRGLSGTPVTLAIERKSEGRNFSVTLKRQEITALTTDLSR